MKIKMNNIFENIRLNKEKISTNRRRNLDNIEQITNIKLNKTQNSVENICHRRRKKVEHKNILNILKSKFVLKKSYYILFVFMFILAGVSVYTNIVTYKDVNNESYTVFSNNDEAEVKQENQSSITQDLNSNNTDTRTSLNEKSLNTNKNTNKNTNTSETVNKATTAVTTKKSTTTNTVIPLSFIRPLQGEIIKIYSTDKLLFSKTLDSWKTHDGVDIKSDLGTSVKSIEKGIIEKIYDDSFFGTTIIIDHGQGYKSIYSNLDSSVDVKEKQVIKKEALIGKVGQTSIGEIKDEAHIHFMLMLNNKVIDPTSKIKF